VTNSTVMKQIELNDREQIQYLLSNPPSWMMRYGISMFAGCFLLLLILSYCIRYPDVIEAKISLTTSNPPIRVIAQHSGRISDLLVHPNQTVVQGQVLAAIENPAHWKDVLRLESWLLGQTTEHDILYEHLELGDLQGNWSDFTQHWKDFQYFNNNGHLIARTELLKEQITQLEQINANLVSQRTILQAEFEFMTKERDRQRLLQSQGVIADAQAEKTEAAWLQQERQIEAFTANFLQNQMQIKQLRGQISELTLDQADGRNDKTLTIHEDKQRLLSTIETWKQNFLVVAPIAGFISLNKVWSAQQSVTAGDEVLAVLPHRVSTNRASIIGKSNVTSADVGKVDLSSRVVIRLDAYPALQYGTLTGNISSIATLPDNETYLVDISMSDSLKTSYGKIIPFRQEMSGQVQIITEERRIIERIFDRINDLLKNK
jgi:multidrug resistance efflux pump